MSEEQKETQPRERKQQEEQNEIQKQIQKAELDKLRLDRELKEIELEERKLALESKKVSDELARLELDEKKTQLDSKKNSKLKGQRNAAKVIAELQAMQAVCNHHCGGDGEIGIKMGQGDLNRPACLGGIQFLSGVIKLSCLRCGKTYWSDMPNGGNRNNKTIGTWAEGLALWRQNQNKVLSVVGGLKVTSTQGPVQLA